MVTPSPKPFKRLIVCCDRPLEASDRATKRDGFFQTNINRMCRAIAATAHMPDGIEIPQIIYHESGIGLISPTGLERAIAGQS